MTIFTPGAWVPISSGQGEEDQELLHPQWLILQEDDQQAGPRFAPAGDTMSSKAEGKPAFYFEEVRYLFLNCSISIQSLTGKLCRNTEAPWRTAIQ